MSGTSPAPIFGRLRLTAGSERADMASVVVLGTGFLAAAVALAATVRSPSMHDLVLLVLLIGVYAIACRNVFTHQGGASVPTEPVFVAMLLLTPLGLVPLAVLVAQLLEGVDRATPRAFARAVLLRMLNCWHCIGPVVVLLVADLGQPELAHWPVYVLAIAAQFAVELTVAALRQWARGTGLRAIAGPLVWTFAVDAVMAVLGLCAVLAAGSRYVSVAFAAVPLVLTRLLAHDRQALADNTADLGAAVATARREARVDALTGLGNRRAWYEAIEAAQGRVAADGELIGHVIAADLDNLKVANDTYGHDVGDELLRALADAFRAIAPVGAVVCRIGGDEFALVYLAAADATAADRLGSALRDTLAGHPPVAGVRLSSAIGTASSPPMPSLLDAFHDADTTVVAQKREVKQRHSSPDLGR